MRHDTDDLRASQNRPGQWHAQDCQAGPRCVHKDRRIALQFDGRGRVVGYSETGLILSPDGVRHRGCPDVTLDQRFDQLAAFLIAGVE